MTSPCSCGHCAFWVTERWVGVRPEISHHWPLVCISPSAIVQGWLLGSGHFASIIKNAAGNIFRQMFFFLGYCFCLCSPQWTHRARWIVLTFRRLLDTDLTVPSQFNYPAGLSPYLGWLMPFTSEGCVSCSKHWASPGLTLSQASVWHVCLCTSQVLFKYAFLLVYLEPPCAL